MWDVSAAGTSQAVATAKNGLHADNGAKIVLNTDQDFLGAKPNSATLSPDGSQIAELSDNYKCWMWDVARGRPRFIIGNKAIGNCYRGYHAAFSADGRKLAVAGAFGKNAQMPGIAVFDALVNVGANGGKLLCPFLRHQGVARYAAFSPDEKRVVTTSDDRTARVWDANTGKPLTPPMLHAAGVTQAEFSPDGSRIVTASEDRTARVWDAATGKPLCAPLRHAGAVVTAQFGADANQIFTVSRDGTARVWILPPATLPSTQISHTLSGIHYFDRTGKLLIYTTNRVYMVNASDGKRIYPADDQNSMFTDAAWSVDKWRIAFCGRNSNARGGKAQVWDALQDRPITRVYPFAQACLSPDGRQLLLRNDDNRTQLVDVDSGQVLSRFTNTIPIDAYRGVSTLFSPDSRRIVVSDLQNRLRLLDTRAGRVVSPPMPHDAPVAETLFSPDGRYLFTYATSRTVRIWNVADGSPAYPPLLHHDSFKAGRSLLFSADGRYALTAYKSRILQWKLDGALTLSPREINISPTAIFFSPDGSLMAFQNQEDWLWNIATNASRTPVLDRNVKLMYTAFSLDSRKILAVRADGAARLWEARAGQPLTSLLTDDQPIVIGAFSRDGKQMVTGGANGSIRLWDAQTGEALAPRLRVSGTLSKDGSELKFTQDGKLVVASNQEQRLWNLPNETESLPLMEARALLLSGQRIDPEIGALPADLADLSAAWQQLSSHH